MILALSCGFEAIFAAIGFNRVDGLVVMGGEVDIGADDDVE
jgi:hypothetical protein